MLFLKDGASIFTKKSLVDFPRRPTFPYTEAVPLSDTPAGVPARRDRRVI